MTTDYVPIDCDRHSVLELLAMRRRKVSVRARAEAGGELRLKGVAFDVLTRGGAEYLLLRDAAGNERPIRLDRLLEVQAADGTPVWRQEIGAD